MLVHSFENFVGINGIILTLIEVLAILFNPFVETLELRVFIEDVDFEWLLILNCIYEKFGPKCYKRQIYFNCFCIENESVNVLNPSKYLELIKQKKIACVINVFFENLRIDFEFCKIKRK